MKRTALMVIILMIALLTCLSAFADHSVLPSAGDLNETQALDIMVSFLCQQMNCSEDEIRGRFHYMATYYPKSSWVNDYRGSLWGVCINSPEPREDVSYAKADINAQTGEIIEFTNEIADEISPGGGHHEMKFVFGMEMPAHRVERIAVRPGLERLALSNLDDFQVRTHICFLRARGGLAAVALSQSAGCAPALTFETNASPPARMAPPRLVICNDTFLTITRKYLQVSPKMLLIACHLHGSNQSRRHFVKH